MLLIPNLLNDENGADPRLARARRVFYIYSNLVVAVVILVLFVRYWSSLVVPDLE